jgi:uncharacterized protein YndB with AHSA1/START domain
VIEQTVHIAASPETVWRYWTDPERMRDWWGVSAQLDPRKGGEYRVTMAQGATMIGEYVELVPHERLVFTLGWDKPTPGGANVPPGSSQVEVTLVPEGDGTVLTLRHSGLPDNAVEDHVAGWTHFLAELAQAAAKGAPSTFS